MLKENVIKAIEGGNTCFRNSKVYGEITANVLCGANINFVCRDGICTDGDNKEGFREFVNEFKTCDLEEVSGSCLLVDNLTKFFIENKEFIEGSFDDIKLDYVGVTYRKVTLFCNGRVLVMFSMDIMELSKLSNKEALDRFAAYSELLAKYTGLKYAAGYRLPGTLAGITGKILKNSKYSKGGCNIAERAYATNIDDYMLQRKFFHGGLQVGNIDKVRRKLDYKCMCYDMTSAYIYSLLANKFPNGSMQTLDLENPLEFDSLDDLVNKLYNRNIMKDSFRLYHVKFGVLSLKPDCKVPYLNQNWVSNFSAMSVGDFNYYVEMGTDVELYLTEPDLEMVLKCYDFIKAEVYACYFFCGSLYIPRYITDVVYDLYTDKKALKGVKESKEFYKAVKVLLNAIYGKIAQRRTVYEDGTVEGGIAPFIWSVYITAYQRKFLYNTIRKFSDKFIFANTDCVWSDHDDNNDLIIEAVNKSLRNSFEAFNKETNRSEDFSGVFDDLGIFVKEHFAYKMFVLTPSRYYMVEKDLGPHRSVPQPVFKCSGLEYADDCMNYLIKEHNVFSAFDILKDIVDGASFEIPAKVARVRHVEVVKDTKYEETIIGYDLNLSTSKDYFNSMASMALRLVSVGNMEVDDALKFVADLSMSDVIYRPY